jgi:hypothetical protein
MTDASDATDANLRHILLAWLLRAAATPSRRVLDVWRAVCGLLPSNWHEQYVIFL